MSTQAVTKQTVNPANTNEERTMFRVLAAVSFCHVLNDMMQSLPSLHLSYPEIILPSQLHPDRLHHPHLPDHCVPPSASHRPLHRPQAHALLASHRDGLHPRRPASAGDRPHLLPAAARSGTGRHGLGRLPPRVVPRGPYGFRWKARFAQSFFQVGGNTGSAIGPLLAVFIILPHGQIGSAWFSLAALLGILVLIQVGRWYKARHAHLRSKPARHADESARLPRGG